MKNIVSRIGGLTAACALVASTAMAQSGGAAAPPAATPNDGWTGAGALNMPIPPAAKLVAITNATILTASHGTIEKGTIIIRDGKIAVKNGKGTMSEFKYVDGATVLPSADEVKKLRPAEAMK